MKFREVCSKCHSRAAIYRKSDPEIRYWKNHNIPLQFRVPQKDQDAVDWMEFDPRDDDNGSLFSFND